MTEPPEIPATVKCPQCGTQLLFAQEMVRRFVTRGRPMICAICGVPLDGWSIVLSAIDENFFHVGAMQLLGCHVFTLQREATPEAPLVEIRLDELGVPDSATVVYVNCTLNSLGGLLVPLASHETFERDPIPHHLYFQLIPVRGGALAAVQASFMFAWFDGAASTTEATYLFDAFHAFSTELRQKRRAGRAARWEQAILAANIAVEVLTVRCVSDLGELNAVAIPDRVSSEHASNVLLPLLAKLEQFSVMPDIVCTQLDALRRARNDIAHRGRTRREIGAQELAKMMTAALFCYHYVTALRAKAMSKVRGEMAT